MSDTKQSMPAQPKTTEIPAVKVPGNTLDAVLLEVRAMREESRSSNQELTDKVEALIVTVDTLQHDAKDTRMQIGRLWREVDEVKDRQTNNSTRVKGESDVNLKQDAAISQVIVKQDELAQKFDDLASRPDTAAVVLDEVRALAKTPAVQKLWGAIVPVLLIAIAALGAKLQASVTKLEEKPETVQPAPTVYLPMPQDGGAR